MMAREVRSRSTLPELWDSAVPQRPGDLHRTQSEVEPGVSHAARRSSDQPLSTTAGRGPKLPVGPPTPVITLVRRCIPVRIISGFLPFSTLELAA
jgi:hypothetical protein